MEVDIQRVNVEVMSISFENNYETKVNELDIFKSIIKKWYKEAAKAGFKKLFSTQEREFIDELYNSFVGEIIALQVSELGNNIKNVDTEFNEEIV
jgi:uncharacterized protein YacL